MEAPPQENGGFEDSPATTLSPNDRLTKFSFLAKILHDSNPKTLPEHVVLRPVKIFRGSDPGEQEEQQSAKNILKKTIIKEGSNRFGERVRENFLMKGKMLTASKKPLENQMHSFLLCLNERINREVEKNDRAERDRAEREKAEKAPELPSLSKQELETTDSVSTKKMSYQDVFRNLKDLRNKRSLENADSPAKPDKLRLNSRVGSKPAQTISYNREEPKSPTSADTASIIKFPLPLVKSSKDIVFQKGYSAYDKEGFHHLEKHRANMQGQYEIVPTKSKEITASAYMLLDLNTLTPISARNPNAQIEIASLTKIATAYLSLLVCRKYAVDIFTHSVRVSEKAAETPGTTAELQNGDSLTVYELLHALMLPSGNDASVAMAEAMGKVIQRFKKKETKRSYYETFIAHMNLLSREFKLEQNWNNSSGLSLSPNYSSPEAILLLTAVAVRNPIFHRVVNTKTYELEIKNERFGISRKAVWRNTNRLLECGWEGVKTGTTENAGHCLIARKDNLLIGVFDCESLSRRFSECVRLHDKYNPVTAPCLSCA